MKNVYRTLILLVVMLFLLAVLSGMWNVGQLRAMFSDLFRDGPPIVTGNPTVTELEAMGDLVVLKVHAVDVLQGEGHGYKGMWIVSGDALIAVDMRAAALTTRENQRATLLLPRPTVLSARVNHERTKTYDVRRSTWTAIITGQPDKLRDYAMEQAQRLIQYAAEKDEFVGTAKENAAIQLQSIYGKVGWDIEVAWQDEQDEQIKTGEVEAVSEGSPVRDIQIEPADS